MIAHIAFCLTPLVATTVQHSDPAALTANADRHYATGQNPRGIALTQPVHHRVPLRLSTDLPQSLQWFD